MALCKLERRKCGERSLVSIKYQNLHSFKEGFYSLMSEYPSNEKNNTFTWLSSLYNPFMITEYLYYLIPSDRQTNNTQNLAFIDLLLQNRCI